MTNSKPDIIVLLGPTASGKTSLSLQIADYFDLEIISADSRQIYKYLDIGTAKPTKSELQKVHHHFISIVNPDEYYSAGIFAKEASSTIQNILNQGKMPLIVGGSGLYIKALCEGLFIEEYDKTQKIEIKNRIVKMKKDYGNDYLFNLLTSIDPEAALMYPDKNPHRIMRALEYYYLTGKKFSSSISNIDKPDFNCIYIGLLLDRTNLYERINQRTEQMWKSGLLDETRQVLKMGYSPDINSLNTVGYKECISYLKGEINEIEALEKIKQHTRNYAKRQMTWFRKIINVNWLEPDEKLLKNSINIIKRFYK